MCDMRLKWHVTAPSSTAAVRFAIHSAATFWAQPATREKTMADTKFAQFISTKKLDQRRILVASRQIETLQPEDRAIRLNKRRARANADSADAAAPKETRK